LTSQTGSGGFLVIDIIIMLATELPVCMGWQQSPSM